MAELKSLIVNGITRLNSIMYGKNVYADKFITNGASSSQFVKGDGSLDSNSYALSNHTHSYLPLSGGTLTGTLLINPGNVSDWKEGIRLLDASNGWTSLTFGGSATSGTGANTWSMHTNLGNFYIALNGSSSYTYGATWTKAGALSIKTSAFTNNGNTVLDAGNYTNYVNTTNFPGLNKTGTVTSVAVSNGGGLSISGSPITTSGTITISHSNSVTAQTTQALYPIKIDANGHISAYGSAVTSLPASDVYAWAKASTKPTYNLDEVADGSTRKLSNYALTTHTHNYAGSSSAGGAATNAVVNNSDSNSNYRMVWHSGNTLYSTDGVYCNPYTDALVSKSLRSTNSDIYAGSASGSQCHMQYDGTQKCMKFIFD